MAVFSGPEIVTNGLVFCIDAENIKSYTGSGNTWFDISGAGNHVTLYSSPTKVTNAIQFNGTTQYAQNSLNLSSGTSSVIACSRYIGSIRGRVISSKINNWVLGHYGVSTANYYAEGWVSSAGAGSGDTNWRIYAATGNYSGDSWAFYVNGVLNAGPNGNGSNGPNGFAIGSWAGSSEFSNSHISFLICYNHKGFVLLLGEFCQLFKS